MEKPGSLIWIESCFMLWILLWLRTVDSVRISHCGGREAECHSIDYQSAHSDQGSWAHCSLKAPQLDALLTCLSGSNWKVNPFCDPGYLTQSALLVPPFLSTSLWKWAWLHAMEWATDPRWEVPHLLSNRLLPGPSFSMIQLATGSFWTNQRAL